MLVGALSGGAGGDKSAYGTKTPASAGNITFDEIDFDVKKIVFWFYYSSTQPYVIYVDFDTSTVKAWDGTYWGNVNGEDLSSWIGVRVGKDANGKVWFYTNSNYGPYVRYMAAG